MLREILSVEVKKAEELQYCFLECVARMFTFSLTNGFLFFFMLSFYHGYTFYVDCFFFSGGPFVPDKSTCKFNYNNVLVSQTNLLYRSERDENVIRISFLRLQFKKGIIPSSHHRSSVLNKNSPRDDILPM